MLKRRMAQGGQTAGRVFQFVVFIFALLVAALPVNGVLAQEPPSFSKTFTPDSIGPGSTTTLRFDIVNSSAAPVTDLAFSDTLPAAVVIATPANVTLSNCSSGGAAPTLLAPDGGGTIAFSNGAVGASATCTIKVDVISTTVGVHTNTTGDLTSSAGNSGTATDDLNVVATRPGFSKFFNPSSVSVGGRSTLTLTIDNTLNATAVTSASFTDNLPTGMVIASPTNASTTCGNATLPATLSAPAGGTTIAFDHFGISPFPTVAAGESCTVIVDVRATGVGALANSTELTADGASAGFANAVLNVFGSSLLITKEFTDDPVGAGGTVTLEFKISNNDRNFPATAVAFTDDLTTLNPALAGLTFSSLISNDCGGSVSGVSGTTIDFSGGTIAPEATCTIKTGLSVPAGAATNRHTNTTSAVTATVNGSPVVGNMASDDLFVTAGAALTFAKEFVPNTVNAGNSVTLRFTIGNPNTGVPLGATDIEFIDELTDGGPGTGFLPFPVSVTLPPTPDPPCGAGSDLSLVSVGFERQGLQLTGGNLGPAEASCSFDVTVNIPADLPGGTYTNTTGQLTATISGDTVATAPASANLTVNGGVNLSFVKEFSGTAVPGGTVDLTFTIESAPESTADATDINFTDDLATVLAGLTASFPPTPDPPCGPGSSFTGSAGDTLLTLAGGNLAPGATCSFTVTLNVPGGAAVGTYPNTTSLLSATPAGGSATTFPAASDDLDVGGLFFTKEFLGDPVIAGDNVTLRFTIDNQHPTDDATITFFTDDLDAALTGLAATGPASVNTCGSTNVGTNSFLAYTGGGVAAGASCEIEVELLVPAGAASGSYGNTTSSLSATLGASAIVVSPARDVLVVQSDLLSLSKSFTDDPVLAGSAVTLEFTLTNLNGAQAASAIGFTDNLDFGGASLPGGLIFDSVLFDDCGGTVTGTGTNLITVSGASLAADGSCTIRTSLTVPAGAFAGSYTNTTSDVFGTIGGFPVDGPAASDVLDVTDKVPPDFSKAFDGPSVAGGTPVLTFTITNNDAVNVLEDIAFTDNLGAVITGLVATGFPSNDCGGTPTGTTTISYSGGSLAAGATCTIVASLQVPGAAAPGTYPNTTSNLRSAGVKVADPATDSLDIEPPPTFDKSFSPNPILFGGISTLTFTIDNGASALAASSLDFTDNLPAGVTVATPPNASTTCTGGTLTAAGGSGVINYTGGSVAAATSCTVQVDVTSSTSGAHVNTTGNLTSSSGNSGTASDTLIVNDQPPLFSKQFTPDVIQTNGLSILTFTIDNSASAAAATALDFTDNMPAAIIVALTARTNTSCTGGTLTATPGTNTISYTGGSVPANATCLINVEVQGTLEGAHTNTSGDLTSSLGNSGPASDVLNVTDLPPVFSKEFTPDTIDAGAISTLTFTINNTVATVPATAVDFTDNLPAEIAVASPANAATTCAGGTLTAASGSSVISYTGGTVPASSSCTISVDVTSATAGSHVNLTGDLTSSLGNSGKATDTLNVNFVLPAFSKQFAPNPIIIGTVTTLTFTIDNTGSLVDATAVDFTDNMPAAITVASPANAATTCTGGAITAASGSSVISYTGGTAPASTSCTVSVDVTSGTAGAHVNVTGDLTSSLGNSGTATDTLNVNLPLGTITIVKNTAPAAAGDGTFDFSSADPDFDAISLTTVGNTATSPAIAKAAGVYTVTEDIVTGWVLSDIACVGDTDGGTVIDLANREVAIDIDDGEAIVCTFTNMRDSGAVIQQTQQAIMEFMEHRADQMTANQPDLVARLKDRGETATTPLAFSAYGTLSSSTSRFATSLHKVKSWRKSLDGEVTGQAPKFDIWMQGFYSHTNTDSATSHLGMVHFGADYLINPDLVVGGIVQLDWAGLDSSTSVATVDGFGWMAGPYFVTNPWQNIYIDGRVAYGQSYNDINPIGTYTDEFDTDRFLATLQVTGDMRFGQLVVNPAAELIYFHERQNAYIDTLGNTIPDQTLELGRVIFGPQFSYNMVLDNGDTLTPSAKFEGIWDFHSKTTPLATGAVETVGGLRGRVDLGLGYRTSGGTSLKASGFYDGIGRSGFEAYGGSLEIVIPLQPEE